MEAMSHEIEGDIMPKEYIGIEIGTRQVKMAWCENHVLCREAVEPLPEYCVKNGAVMSMEVMAGFLKRMAKKYDSRCRFCCLVLPDDVAYTKRLVMPAMSVKHLKLNLPYEFHDLIRNQREAFLFDYAVMGLICDENKRPVSMDLMAAAVPKGRMEEYRQMLRLAGWKLKSAAPTAFAYSAFIREYEKQKNRKEPGDYCFIDLGYETTKVLFFHGKAMEACRHIENQRIEGEGQAFYDAIGMEIRRTLEFYYFRNPDKRFDKLYFCGGGSMIESFRRTVAEYAALAPGNVGELIPVSMGGKENIISPAAVGVTFCL